MGAQVVRVARKHRVGTITLNELWHATRVQSVFWAVWQLLLGCQPARLRFACRGRQQPTLWLISFAKANFHALDRTNFRLYFCQGALRIVPCVPSKSDAETPSERRNSGRYRGWNIAQYSAIEMPHIALYADPQWYLCAHMYPCACVHTSANWGKAPFEYFIKMYGSNARCLPYNAGDFQKEMWPQTNTSKQSSTSLPFCLLKQIVPFPCLLATLTHANGSRQPLKLGTPWHFLGSYQKGRTANIEEKGGRFITAFQNACR